MNSAWELSLHGNAPSPGRAPQYHEGHFFRWLKCKIKEQGAYAILSRSIGHKNPQALLARVNYADIFLFTVFMSFEY